MLKESYISNWKNLPEDAIKIRVARPSILGPSEKLLWDYKNGKINWQEYKIQFRLEIISNPEAMKELDRISALSKTKDVYLICYEKEYPCHRFILIDIIKEMEEYEQRLKDVS